MAIQDFDKLNILQRHSMPYDDYYGDMLLTDQQKKKRKDTALILEDVLAIIFEVLYAQMVMGMVDEVGIKQQFIYELYDAFSQRDFFDSDEQFEEYLIMIVNEIIDTTLANMEKHPNDYDYKGEKPYWVSEDRAMFIAEDQANILCNNSDYLEAIAEGKTHKIWMAYPDDNVRATHVEVNGVELPITAYFDVGGARMLFPGDVTSELSTGKYYPQETIRCRCTIKYI